MVDLDTGKLYLAAAAAAAAGPAAALCLDAFFVAAACVSGALAVA